MPDLLFVYGTLRREFDNPHAHRLRASAQFAGVAKVRGSVVSLGPYLAFRPGPVGEVPGELWRIDAASGILAALDDYEGAEYQRVATVTTDGQPVWIYQLV